MQLLNTLYVNTPGSYLRLDNATLRVDVERETRLRVQSGVAQARGGDTGDDDLLILVAGPLILHLVQQLALLGTTGGLGHERCLRRA